VLEQIRHGLTYKQIALELGLSLGTICRDVNMLLRQHGVRTQAALRAKLAAADRESDRQPRVKPQGCGAVEGSVATAMRH
jgi:hypothetical protein